MSAPILLSADAVVRETLLRLAAAAGVNPVVLLDPVAALSRWASAPLILIGWDLAGEVARLGPARRPGVHVVASGASPDDVYRVAMAAGAESVVDLGGSQAWLIEQLTDAGSPRAAGRVVAVLGGSGGAGATTFACALGQAAAQRGEAIVVDCDPLGPGVDRVLGLDATPGHRWDGLAHTTGRLSAAALRSALPRRDRLAVLSWTPGEPASLQAFAVREVLSAAQRGHDVVVLDLPRAPDPVVDEVLARCTDLLVVVVPSVTGVASAARVVARHGVQASCRLVVRGHGVDARAVGRAVGAPVVAEMGDQRGVGEAVDLGLGPLRSRRGVLWRACELVLTAPTRQVAA